jgi:hypothetical protein
MFDHQGDTIFGAIEQKVVKYEPSPRPSPKGEGVQ